MYRIVTLSQYDAATLSNYLHDELADTANLDSPTYNELAIACVDRIDVTLQNVHTANPIQLVLTPAECRLLIGIADNRVIRSRFLAFSTRRTFARIGFGLSAALRIDA